MRLTIRAAVFVFLGLALGQDASAQALGTIAGSAKETSGAVSTESSTCLRAHIR